MEKYVQYGFSVAQRNDIFGINDWNTLISQDNVYAKLQLPTTENKDTENSIEITELLNPNSKDYYNLLYGDKKKNENEESPDRFNTIINFANYLLHILRIQTQKDIPLDDKRLMETFEPYYKNNKDFVMQFGYNLLKGKFFFDKYIIKREFISNKDHWSLQKLVWSEGNKAYYKNTFGEDTSSDINREILMLLSMFHISSPTLVYKHWLNASLKYVLEKGTFTAEEYKIYLENLAKAFLYDRFLAKNPKDYFEILYTNNGEQKNTTTAIDISKLNQGTEVENFIFNYLDYLLWQNYRTLDREYFKIKNGQTFTDNRIKDFEYTFRSSVEHYYPQHPIDENLVLKGSDTVWLDNFGNLCLISSSKNSRLSNFLPSQKKEFYSGSQTIDSIKQRIMMEYDNWDTNGTNNFNEIEHHYNKMVELLMKNIQTSNE